MFPSQIYQSAFCSHEKIYFFTEYFNEVHVGLKIKNEKSGKN